MAKCEMVAPEERPEGAVDTEAEPMPDLDRAAILAAPVGDLLCVPVPEWGGNVYVRTLSDDDVAHHALACQRATTPDGAVDSRGLRAKLLVRALADSAGNVLFAKDDIKELSAKGFRVLDRLFDAVQDFNCLTPDALGGLEKN